MFNGRSFWFITDAEDGCMTSAFQWLDHLGQRCALNISKKKRNDCWSLELPTASLKPSSVEPCGQHTPILTATKLLKTDEYCGHMTHGQKFQQLCNIFQGTMTIQRCSTFWTNWQIETKNESREVVRSEPSSHIFTLFQKKHPDMLPLSTRWHNTGAN